MKMPNALLAALLASLPMALFAAGATRSATPGAAPPAAKLADLAWLRGEWRGPGIDKAEASELWAEARAGQMVGLFRQMDAKGDISFYELMTLVQVGTTLEMRIKHFDAKLHAWEKQDEVTTFPLVAVEQDVWYFNGLTLRREARHKATITVRVKEAADQPPVELVFRYTRID